MSKTTIPLFFILFLAAFLRFWQLGDIPQGVTHDEMGYIYNSYLVAKTAKNIHGEFLPFLTWLTEGFPYMPVPIYFSAPFFWFLPLTSMSGRLSSVLLGIVDVVLLFLLVKYLFKSTSLALLSSLFLAISPWHIFITRSSYDTNFSSFFFFLGITLFVLGLKKKYLKFFSLISLFLALFSYRGMNAAFGGIVIVLISYGWFVMKMKLKHLALFILGIILILSIFLFIAKSNAERGYVREAMINTLKMQEEIDTRIRESEGPLFIRRMYLNKVTYVIDKWRNNYLESFSPGFLFLRGERDKVTSIWTRGKIYVIDVIVIFIGIYYLLKINSSSTIFIVGLLLSSALPGMISGPIYASRNFLLSFFFPILSAGGIFFITKQFSNKLIRYFVIIVLCLIYAYLLGSFLFDYFGRFKLYAAEAWFKSVKEISVAIEKEKNNYKNVVVATSSIGELMQYAFYAKIDPAIVQNSVVHVKKGKTHDLYTVGNVSFTGECFKSSTDGLPVFKEEKPILYIVHEYCVKNSTPSARIKDYFGNTVWEMYQIKE